MLIPRSVFAIAKMTHCPGHSRYAIDCVRIERHGNQCVAAVTDGKAMVEVTWDDSTLKGGARIAGVSSKPVLGFAVNIPVPIWCEVGKRVAAKGHALLDESVKSNRVKLAIAAGGTCVAWAAEANKGPFPKHREIIPTYSAEESTDIGFYPEVFNASMETLAKAVESTERDHGVRVTIPHDRTRPAILRASGKGVSGVAVTMPCQLDEDSNG